MAKHKPKKNKDMIRFAGRRHTKTGVFSFIIGILVVAGFLTISILSGIRHGEGGAILGIIGLCLLAFAIFGFVLSYKAFKQKDVFYRFPIIGILLNGFMTVILLVIYILGFGG